MAYKNVLIMLMIGTVFLAGCVSPPSSSLFGAAQFPGMCKDTDMGINYGVKGTTSAGSQQRVDQCNGNQITEYYCMMGTVKSVTGTCDQNQVCKDGECAPSSLEACSVSEYGVIRHTDSEGVTDNWVSGCDKEGKLVQYSCTESGGLIADVLECPAGQICISDACVAPDQ